MAGLNLTVWTSRPCARTPAQRYQSSSCTGRCVCGTEQWHPGGCYAESRACRSVREDHRYTLNKEIYSEQNATERDGAI